MTDHDDLVAKYSTPVEDMDSETRSDTEEWRRHLADLEANGAIATEEQFERQNYPIGLDDNFNPFPPPKRRDHDADDSEAGPS